MGTLYSAIAIFGMTAILGMYLLSLLLRKKSTPKGISILHGLFAVIGLVLLIVYCVGHNPGPSASIIVFTLAALGGFLLIYKDITGRTIPAWLGIAHGATAVVGYALLIVFVFR